MISNSVSKPLSAHVFLLRKPARVVRQYQVFSALSPLLIKAEVRQASERRELARSCSGCVVLAALFSRRVFLVLLGLTMRSSFKP